uniref:Uncharacterized protein n=1 Tax=Rousettus aegyptiacus TaxID=9407 RepID=A0A7J8HRM8_ROUAE|nr:hypothetical protein HJG63_010874 [Rousettus aegyptiacus]
MEKVPPAADSGLINVRSRKVWKNRGLGSLLGSNTHRSSSRRHPCASTMQVPQEDKGDLVPLGGKRGGCSCSLRIRNDLPRGPLGHDFLSAPDGRKARSDSLAAHRGAHGSPQRGRGAFVPGTMTQPVFPSRVIKVP